MHFVTDKQALFSIMYSCHTLYQAGIPHLLRLVSPVRLSFSYSTYHEVLDSFSLFISSDPIRRGAIIHDLGMFPPSSQDYLKCPESVAAFVGALQQLSALKVLELYGAESWLKLSDEFEETVTGFRHLEALKLNSHNESSSSDKSIDVLKHMTSPLKALDIETSFTSEHQNLFHILGHFSSTLVYLGANRIILDDKTLGPVYPNLTSIRLRWIGSESMSIVPLIRCAPNLQRLSIQNFSPRHSSVLERVRDANKWDQLRYESWPRLDAVLGDVDSIYALSLRTHVRFVRIFDSLESGESLCRWKTVLRDTWPTHIGLAIRISNFTISDLSSIIPDKVGEKVTHLCLGFYFSLDDNPTSLSSVMVSGFAIQPSSSMLTIISFVHKASSSNPPQRPYQTQIPPSVIQLEQRRRRRRRRK